MLNEIKKADKPLFFSKNSAFTPLEKKNLNEKPNPIINPDLNQKIQDHQPLKNSVWDSTVNLFSSNIHISHLLSIFGFCKENKKRDSFEEFENKPLIENEQIENLEIIKP